MGSLAETVEIDLDKFQVGRLKDASMVNEIGDGIAIGIFQSME